MRIFVTGASGFLGSVLLSHLKDHEVTAVSSKECDLRDPASLTQFDSKRFDRIYHLAVWTQSGDFCLRHPAEQFLINQQINTHVLNWWQQSQPQAKLIAIGTSCAYDTALPLEESHYLSGKPIDSLFAFAMSKRMLLCGLQAMHQQYGLNYLFPIPATLYGVEGFQEEGKQMHFIFDLVRKIVRGKKYGEPVVLWGTGEQRRELLHAHDFCKAIIRLSDTHTNETINIGEGYDHSIKEFAQTISELAEYPFSKIEFDTSRYVGAKAKLISTHKLKIALPQFAPRTLRQGLSEMVDYVMALA